MHCLLFALVATCTLGIKLDINNIDATLHNKPSLILFHHPEYWPESDKDPLLTLFNKKGKAPGAGTGAALHTLNLQSGNNYLLGATEYGYDIEGFPTIVYQDGPHVFYFHKEEKNKGLMNPSLKKLGEWTKECQAKKKQKNFKAKKIDWRGKKKGDKKSKSRYERLKKHAKYIEKHGGDVVMPADEHIKKRKLKPMKDKGTFGATLVAGLLVGGAIGYFAKGKVGGAKKVKGGKAKIAKGLTNIKAVDKYFKSLTTANLETKLKPLTGKKIPNSNPPIRIDSYLAKNAQGQPELKYTILPVVPAAAGGGGGGNAGGNRQPARNGGGANPGPRGGNAGQGGRNQPGVKGRRHGGRRPGGRSG